MQQDAITRRFAVVGGGSQRFAAVGYSANPFFFRRLADWESRLPCAATHRSHAANWFPQGGGAIFPGELTHPNAPARLLMRQRQSDRRRGRRDGHHGVNATPLRVVGTEVPVAAGSCGSGLVLGGRPLPRRQPLRIDGSAAQSNSSGRESLHFLSISLPSQPSPPPRPSPPLKHA